VHSYWLKFTNDENRISNTIFILLLLIITIICTQSAASYSGDEEEDDDATTGFRVGKTETKYFLKKICIYYKKH